MSTRIERRTNGRATAPPANQPAAPTSPPSTATVRDRLTWFSTIFAPATLVGALLLYVGWVRTRAFFTYFGINAMELGLSPQDYVLRSADVGLGAVVLIALAGGVLLVLDRIIVRLLRQVRGRRREGLIHGGIALVGCSLAFAGLFSLTAEASLAGLPPMASAGFVAVGAVLLLRFGADAPGRAALLGPSTTNFGLAIIALTSFWAANSYAHSFGVAAAEAVDADSSRFSVVAVSTQKPIDVPGSLVVASRVPDAEGKWFYRYVGPRLLTYANGRMFLIVTPRQGGYRSTIFTLREADTIRVETATPDSA